MSFYISKSRFVSAWAHCNKYAWLEKHMPEKKAPVSEFTESLFSNGHLVGELAKEYFCVEADLTATKADGSQDSAKMLKERTVNALVDFADKEASVNNKLCFFHCCHTPYFYIISFRYSL